MRYNPSKHRLPPFHTSGVLLVDKPLEWTSFDVVNFVRSRFNIPKVGHCGTLDPAASGLLVLVLGKFTQLSSKFSGEDKVYEAKLQLGLETDSGDLDGEVISTRDWSAVTPELLRETLAGFVGEQLQTPPMVSAVKKDGKKLYELARQGVEVEARGESRSRFSRSTSRSLNCRSANSPCAVRKGPTSVRSAPISAESSAAAGRWPDCAAR